MFETPVAHKSVDPRVLFNEKKPEVENLVRCSFRGPVCDYFCLQKLFHLKIYDETGAKTFDKLFESEQEHFRNLLPNPDETSVSDFAKVGSGSCENGLRCVNADGNSILL
jgi:hypothetical protein